jgi:hypothetical protein
MDKDPFELEADIDATRELVKIVGLKLAEVFVYSGDRHLFADSSPTVVRRRRGGAGCRAHEFLNRAGYSGQRLDGCSEPAQSLPGTATTRASPHTRRPRSSGTSAHHA